MLEESFLEKWVPILVPKELGPNSDPEAGKPILGIYISSEEKMEESKNQYYSIKEDDTILYGVISNIGQMFELIGQRRPQLVDKFVIQLNRCLSETAGIFTLLHEVGHVYGKISFSKEHDENPESYADMWALDRASDVIEDDELFSRLMLESIKTYAIR